MLVLFVCALLFVVFVRAAFLCVLFGLPANVCVCWQPMFVLLCVLSACLFRFFCFS